MKIQELEKLTKEVRAELENYEYDYDPDYGDHALEMIAEKYKDIDWGDFAYAFINAQERILKDRAQFYKMHIAYVAMLHTKYNKIA